VNDLRLILVSPEPLLCAEFREQFAERPNVEIVDGYFESLPEFDCLVSPANSFGLMDGGTDAAITRFFGDGLQKRVQKLIIEEYCGEQPVGTSIIVPTGHLKHPYLAHTPTMRIPMPIARTDYAYLATWAVLTAVHHHNRQTERQIQTVACPDLGIGVGRMPFREAARQIALAYQNYPSPPRQITWHFASERQRLLGRGGDLSAALPKSMSGW
jgi:O-acetyl-ADP-ribose deacetylase (regulator of RNase III)